MKTTLVLCCFMMLAGCGGGQETGKGYPQPDAMDSPIIISDGSTHLRHKGGSGNPNGNFTIISQSANQTTLGVVTSTSTSVSKIQFYGGGWKGNPQDISPAPGWALNVYSDSGATLTLALSSPNPATTTVATAVFNVPVQISYDTSDTNGGTSIDASTNIVQINYAPAGGSLASYATCATPGKCKIKFHYNGN